MDDGWGWKDDEGDIWTFIAYYNHWGIWRDPGYIQQSLNKLIKAYVYTGDDRYARKGLLLLDRIADVYPDMDISAYQWDDGFDNGDPKVHSAQGNITHDISETILIKTFIMAYDAFYPAIDSCEELITFLSEKADCYGLERGSRTTVELKNKIEDRIIRQVYGAVRESRVRGNIGMHHSALALAAVVLDEEGTSGFPVSAGISSEEAGFSSTVRTKVCIDRRQFELDFV